MSRPSIAPSRLSLVVVPLVSVAFACTNLPLADFPLGDPALDDAGSIDDDEDSFDDVGDVSDDGLGEPLVVASPCRDGWCWERPADPGLNLAAIAGVAKNDVWAGGEGGHLLHFDGTTFRAYVLDELEITGLFADAPHDVVVTGHHPQGGARSVRIRDGVVRPFTVGGAAAQQVFGVPGGARFAIAGAGVYRLDDDGGATLLLPLEGHIMKRGVALRDDVIFVGFGGSELWRMDGTTWSQIWPVDGAPPGARAPLVATRADDGSLFFFSASFDEAPAYVARLVDATWTFWLDVPPFVTDIAASTRDDALLVTPSGIFRLVDEAWETAEYTEGHVAALVVDDQHFVVGRGGTVTHAGADLDFEIIRGSAHRSIITDVIGLSDGTLLAGDYRHGLWTRDDEGWTRHSGGGSYFSLAGDDVHGVYAASGPSPAVWRYDVDTGWRYDVDTGFGPLPAPPTHTNRVHVTADGRVLTGNPCRLVSWSDGAWVDVPLDAELMAIDDGPCMRFLHALFDDGDGALYMVSSERSGTLYRLVDDVWTLLYDESPAFDGVSLEHAAHDGAHLLVVDARGRVFADDGAGPVDLGAPEPRASLSGSWLGAKFTIHAFSSSRFFVAGRAGDLREWRDGAWIVHTPPVATKQITSVWLDDDGALTIVGDDGMIVRKVLDD